MVEASHRIRCIALPQKLPTTGSNDFGRLFSVAFVVAVNARNELFISGLLRIILRLRTVLRQKVAALRKGASRQEAESDEKSAKDQHKDS